MTTTITPTVKKVKPKDKPHYVNNAMFSQAVVDYVTTLNEARESCIEQPFWQLAL